MNDWMKYRNRNKQRALDYLGGVCVVCETTEGLEFDHIDPNTKEFVISQKMNWAWDRLVKELDKCQLLCKTHHRDKTNKESAKPLVHGTAMGYRKHKCRCPECRAYNTRVVADWKRRKNAETSTLP